MTSGGIYTCVPPQPKEPTKTTTRLSHDQLVSSINSDPERLADLLAGAGRDYDRLLEKLDTQAGWIAEKMERLRASIARSRETDPSTLSVNSLGFRVADAPPA